MLEFNVIPEHSLGCENCEFKLGMQLKQAVFILQQHCRSIGATDVIYVENDPLAGDLILKLCDDGVRLIFDSYSQRLKIIEVYDMTKVRLKYCGLLFCSPEASPNRETIDLSFGATRPPEYDTLQQCFVLSFRGISFCFPAAMNKNSAERCTPQFPNRNVATVSKMSIFSGNSLADAKAPDLPWHCYHGGTFLSSLDVVRDNSKTVGIQVHLLFEGLETSVSPPNRIKDDVRTVCFGNTVQDVLSLLGAPAKVFYKSDDKMKIHAPPDQQHRRASDRSDYFFNYFTLGLDILFDAVTQRAKKFILHTNFPGHYDFNVYYRCMFTIPLMKANSIDNFTQTSSLLDQPELIVKWYSKLDEIHTFMLGPESRPIVLNRSSSVNATNPFGSTYCYGYEDMIFEFMPNGHIASVTLYEMKG